MDLDLSAPYQLREIILSVITGGGASLLLVAGLLLRAWTKKRGQLGELCESILQILTNSRNGCTIDVGYVTHKERGLTVFSREASRVDPITNVSVSGRIFVDGRLMDNYLTRAEKRAIFAQAAAMQGEKVKANTLCNLVHAQDRLKINKG
jgi:hypothetical protein